MPDKKIETPMNVYQKIQRVRAELVKLNLKQSGINRYSNYTYYELGDFLPQINRLMDELGLTTRFVIWPAKSNQKERAVLEVFNASKPEEKITFISETTDVTVGKKKDGTGGAMPIQNLGAKITYMRRYLLLIAFEIVEADAVERTPAKQVSQTLDTASLKMIAQARDLEALAVVCKDIKSKKGPKYQAVLMAAYTAKKGELEK